MVRPLTRILPAPWRRSRRLVAGATLALALGSAAAGQPAPVTAKMRTPNASGAPDPSALEIGRGGADGFVAAGPAGAIHVVFGPKYRTGASPQSLGAAEQITELSPVNGVRIAVDGANQPHVVFTTGATDRAKRSYYTARIGGRWLPAEKFADVADFPERERAYVADVAVNETGFALVSFWVSRPREKRAEFDNPSFYYRWRTPAGQWHAPRSLPAHWSSAPKVEYARGRGFFLMWQHRGSDWRIAGPVSAGSPFAVEQSFSCGSDALTAKLSNVQNEGADFCVGADGMLIVAGNIREKFEGPVGVWAAAGRPGALEPAVYLGSFPGTVRGSESGVHPVLAYDADTSHAYAAMMDPKTRTARWAVRRRASGWEPGYPHLLPGRSTPQGTLRQGPSVVDVPGPGVMALVRDGEERWFLVPLAGR